MATPRVDGILSDLDLSCADCTPAFADSVAKRALRLVLATVPPTVPTSGSWPRGSGPGVSAAGLHELLGARIRRRAPGTLAIAGVGPVRALALAARTSGEDGVTRLWYQVRQALNAVLLDEEARRAVIRRRHVDLCTPLSDAFPGIGDGTYEEALTVILRSLLHALGKDADGPGTLSGMKPWVVRDRVFHFAHLESALRLVLFAVLVDRAGARRDTLSYAEFLKTSLVDNVLHAIEE